MGNKTIALKENNCSLLELFKGNMHHKYDISLKDAFHIIHFAVGIVLFPISHLGESFYNTDQHFEHTYNRLYTHRDKAT